jgi:hypothetical protein
MFENCKEVLRVWLREFVSIQWQMYLVGIYWLKYIDHNVLSNKAKNVLMIYGQLIYSDNFI